MKRALQVILLLALFSFCASAQRGKNNAATGNPGTETVFTRIISLDATPVKDQASTSTCWCFATTSFIESELLRKGAGEYDLSEMFIVRHNYTDRIKNNYLRQGVGNIAPGGGQAHDWMTVFREKGIVPDEIYTGLNYGSARHNHSELNDYLTAVAAVAVKRKKESRQYQEIISSILDSYLGKVPESFTWKGKTFTPREFAESLNINPGDYVEITSFTHFPFYTQGVLEVPDNWRMERFYNVPLDELIRIMDYSLENGFTVNWDGDTSEKGFDHRMGVASVPEQVVTQESRQAGFENFTTTDDHLMHITGISKDQKGERFYITKNSWGPSSNSHGGYLNMSENYVRAKTIFIMVHRDGIPPAIRSRMGIN